MPRGKPGLGFFIFWEFYFLVAHGIFLAGIGVGGAREGRADCIFYVYLGSCTIYCICFGSWS
jgi:hypothetical protein